MTARGVRSRCPICKRPKQAKFPYCLNCHKKLAARGRKAAPKQYAECRYGRCHKHAAKDFFGFPREYCSLHQKQKDHGLIR